MAKAVDATTLANASFGRILLQSRHLTFEVCSYRTSPCGFTFSPWCTANTCLSNMLFLRKCPTYPNFLFVIKSTTL